MKLKRGNIRMNLPDASKQEQFEDLAFPGKNVRIERIVSEGQTSPAGFWYDQAWSEWVMIMDGGAEIEFDDPAGIERLSPGDWLLIPAGRRHRVKTTLPGTLWLAVHAQ